MRYLFLLCVLLLFGCSTPIVIPRFAAPSAVPTQRAIERTSVHIDAAALQVKTLKELIAKAVSLAGENKPLQLTLAMADKQVDALTAELLSAKVEATSAKASLGDLDAANQKLVGEVNVYVARAQATIDKLTASRGRWRKTSIYEGLALLAAGLWIFKKPLLMLIGL